VWRLLEKYLSQGVLESGKDWQPTEQGIPQGAVISPILANIYLDPLDHQMAGRGREMILLRSYASVDLAIPDYDRRRLIRCSDE